VIGTSTGTSIGASTGVTAADAAVPAPPQRSSSVPRWVRRTVIVVAALLALAVGYYVVTLYQVRSTGGSDQARPVDAIVVMGAAQYDCRPSPQLANRLDHVVDLWQRGLAPLVVTTGGNRPGDRCTEAGSSAAYLEARGVPSAAILREEEGANSYDSLVNARDLLVARGARRVLLVSDPFHMLRIRLIAQELGLTAYVSPAPGGSDSWGREMQEAAGIAVGRIIGFGRLTRITG
jgi:uncharacterized SAM-binding protein YcdF (DUF218 family)